MGIGTVFGAFQVALARNPGLPALLFRYAVLGFAPPEAIAPFGLMVAFRIPFALLPRWGGRRRSSAAADRG